MNRVGFNRIFWLAVRTFGMVFGAMLAAAGPLHGQLFTGLGHLPRQNLNYATELSDDGRVVVGISMFYDPATVPVPQFQAYRWTASTGMAALPKHFASEQDSGTYAVSGDGSTIASHGLATDGSLHAFRVRPNEAPQDLGDLPGGRYETRGNAISADGSVIAGEASGTISIEPVRWTEQTGLVPLGFQAGTFGPNRASAMSRDGKVIIGYGRSALTTTKTGSFRWTEETGLVSLDQPGDKGSLVFAVSDDGEIIVGDNGSNPLRWTPAKGFAPLPVDARFGSEDWTRASDLTGDGSMIVGWASKDRGETTSAVLWDRTDRVWQLDSLLLKLGFDLDGWSLTTANAISGDGRYIAGGGVHDGVSESYLLDFGPRGFVSPVPEPTLYGVASVLALLIPIFARRRAHQKSEQVNK